MKVDKSQDIYCEKASKAKELKKAHDCKLHDSFAKMLEQLMEKDVQDEKLRLHYSEEKKTSLFFEKKVGKKRTDIFDTLIDI